MKTVQIIENDGVFTLEGFDVEISKWKEMLQDASVFDDKSLTMVKQWYYEDGHSSSSKIMTTKYYPSLSNTPYNGIVVGLGKRILKYLKCYEIEREDDSDCFWITVFDGWYENNCFIWRLKKEICVALEELNYVGDFAIERPKFWIFPCNAQYYNVYGAFEKYNELFWRQHLANIKIGDKVFIYVGKPESKLSFYCEVVEINVDFEKTLMLDDKEFYLESEYEKRNNYKYVKLKLLKHIYDDRFNLHLLNKNGIRGNVQGQQEIVGDSLKYLLDMLNHNFLNIREIEDKVETFIVSYLEDEQKKLKECEIERQKFLKKFPINLIPKINLKDYCLGLDNNDNFCYFLEIRLKASGSIKGGNSQKFGLFYSKDNQKYEVVSKWSKTRDENEALTNIKLSIEEVIKASSKFDFHTLENNKLSTMFKGKILSTYYPELYVGVFNDEDFEHFFYKFGVPHNKKLSTVRKQYQLSKLKMENKVFDSLSFEEFMAFLYTMYGQDLLEKKKLENKRNSYSSYKLSGQHNDKETQPNPVKKRLIKENYNFVKNTIIEKTSKRKGNIDFDSLQKKRTAVGLSGEELVMDYEIEQLKSWGIKSKPEHVALLEPSAGYDIVSYDEYGNKKYIEVKTRKAKNSTKLDFFITSNEKEKFDTLEGYVIYFVSDLNSNTPKLRIINKELFEKLLLEPIAYHVKAEIEVVN